MELPVEGLAQPTTQALFLEMRFQGQKLATGTGFVVVGRSGPVLVTNRHNLTGRDHNTEEPLSPRCGIPDEVVIWQHSSLGLGAWVQTHEPLLVDDQPRWREHPSLGERADIAALPLTDLGTVRTYPIDPSKPGDDFMIGPGDATSVIGFPFGLTGGLTFPIWATGFIATELQFDWNDLPVFLIDCRARPGQSGSPVITHRPGGLIPVSPNHSSVFFKPAYRFLGIYSGRINEQSDLGMVWKASAVAELIEAM